jgi:hypothetical protein
MFRFSGSLHEPEPSIEDDALDTLRLADTDTARRYPLPVTGPATWRAMVPELEPLRPDVGPDASGWRQPGHTLEIALPDLPAGTLLVPSCALADAPGASHRWTLRAGASVWSLPWVRPPAGVSATQTTGPAPAAAAAPAHQPDNRARTAIDCFELNAALGGDDAGPILLTLEVDTATAPARYLVTVSARPHRLPDVPAPQTAVTPVANVPAISQMTADAAIARRICSPTSLTMALAAVADQHAPAEADARSCAETQAEIWQRIVTECHDPATGMYGIWPLALAAAARRGHLGAVELFSDWEAPLAALARGIPVVASIRFGPDALPGAPLRETAGHLVVIVGAGPDNIVVHDPAAPTHDTVARQYAPAAFARAWLANRGAAYILCA